MNRVYRRLLGGLLLVLVLAAGLFSLRWGLASVELWRAAKVHQQLESEAGDITLAQRRLNQARMHLARAERMRGVHPDQLDLAGQLLHWQALHFVSVGQERSLMLSEAADYFRQAIRLRPSWPYFWANLAAAKADWGIFDQEFRQALRQAVKTGPWEGDIQMRMIRLGFVEQRNLDRRSRALIDETLRRALQIQSGRVLQLAREFGQMTYVCAWVNDPRLERQCAPYRPVEAAAGS